MSFIETRRSFVTFTNVQIEFGASLRYQELFDPGQQLRSNSRAAPLRCHGEIVDRPSMPVETCHDRTHQLTILHQFGYKDLASTAEVAIDIS